MSAAVESVALVDRIVASSLNTETGILAFLFVVLLAQVGMFVYAKALGLDVDKAMTAKGRAPAAAPARSFGRGPLMRTYMVVAYPYASKLRSGNGIVVLQAHKNVQSMALVRDFRGGSITHMMVGASLLEIHSVQVVDLPLPRWRNKSGEQVLITAKRFDSANVSIDISTGLPMFIASARSTSASTAVLCVVVAFAWNPDV